MKLFLKTGLNPRELWKYGSDSAFFTAKFGFWDGFLEVTSRLSFTNTVCVLQYSTDVICVCMHGLGWGNALVFEWCTSPVLCTPFSARSRTQRLGFSLYNDLLGFIQSTFNLYQVSFCHICEHLVLDMWKFMKQKMLILPDRVPEIKNDRRPVLIFPVLPGAKSQGPLGKNRPAPG